MDWTTRLTLICICGIIFGGNKLARARAQSFDIIPREPHPQFTSFENWRASEDSSEDEDSSMWPYPTYKPISWEKYYATDNEKHITLTSGLAAGITIAVFFAVFLLTFGCRLYTQRSEIRRPSSRPTTQSTRNFCQRRLSVSDLFACNSQLEPPPPYHVAIQLPSNQPPPFTPTAEPTRSA